MRGRSRCDGSQWSCVDTLVLIINSNFPHFDVGATANRTPRGTTLSGLSLCAHNDALPNFADGDTDHRSPIISCRSPIDFDRPADATAEPLIISPAQSISALKSNPPLLHTIAYSLHHVVSPRTVSCLPRSCCASWHKYMQCQRRGSGQMQRLAGSSNSRSSLQSLVPFQLRW